MHFFRLKRLLYLSHRWLGIAVCLFMVLWFISGVVMMYIGYPKLTVHEHLAGMPKLSANTCCIEFERALKSTEETASPDNIRITTVAGKPRYIFSFGKQLIAVDGLSGTKISAVSIDSAMESVETVFVNSKGKYLGIVDEDAWTHSRALDQHRPLHLVAMDDQNETWLYVSGKTGEIVRDANLEERTWNWIGAWLHWLYPFRGGALDKIAPDIVIYSSLAGTVLTITGLIVGILRWRFVGTYKQGKKTPYKSKLMRWHHYFGLVFGVIAFTWVISGLFSVNPWKIFDHTDNKPQHKLFMGADFSPATLSLSISHVIESFNQINFFPVEIEMRLLNGKGYFIGIDLNGNSMLLENLKDTKPTYQFTEDDLEKATKKLFPTAEIVSKQTLTAYDFYYYTRAPHTMTGHVDKKLPIYRFEFNDNYKTWVQVDPYLGSFTVLDSHKRVKRILFSLLHSWDWLPLLNIRPLWDILMIVFSIGGFIISVTGVFIGVKRLRYR